MICLIEKSLNKYIYMMNYEYYSTVTDSNPCLRHEAFGGPQKVDEHNVGT